MWHHKCSGNYGVMILKIHDSVGFDYLMTSEILSDCFTTTPLQPGVFLWIRLRRVQIIFSKDKRWFLKSIQTKPSSKKQIKKGSLEQNIFLSDKSQI